MRRFQWLLAIALVMGLFLPATALAHTKVRTRVTLLNGSSFERYWQYETTSTTPPTVKARLTYYQRSTGKWVGYGYRPVTLANQSEVEPTVVSRKTDKSGYFTFKLNTSGTYQLRHPADHYSYSSSKSVDRIDRVHVETTTRVTTASIDASNTRIDIEIDYLYNPYIPEDVGADAAAYTMNIFSEDYDYKFLYSGWCADPAVPRTGSATARLGFVVPTSLYSTEYIFVMPGVSYFGQYFCENTSEEDGLFGGVVVNPEITPPYEDPEDHTGDPEWDF